MGPGEIIRRSYDAFNDRDLATLEEFIHPEFAVELENSIGFDRGSHRGMAGLRRFFVGYWDSFEELSVELEQLIGEAPAIVAIVMVRGRGTGSGVLVEQRGPHLWTFRDGMVASLALYGDRERAISDADRLRAGAPAA